MKDPVTSDLNRHLADQEAREGIDRYIVDHEGVHPCDMCDEDCRKCKIRNYRHYGRGE
jgi:hypothetical protein